MRVKGFKDTINWYDENAEKYAKSTRDLASIEFIERFVTLVEFGKVLDAGCGSGRDTYLLQEQGLKPVGLDLSKGLLDQARKQFPECEFIHGSFLNLPFSDESFMGVWAHASLLHLETVEDVSTALLEFFRVLKNGGVFHALVKAQTGDNKTELTKDTLSGHDRFFQYFTVSELAELIQDAGFELIEIDQHREIDKNPKGRPEVEWIVVFAKKPE